MTLNLRDMERLISRSGRRFASRCSSRHSGAAHFEPEGAAEMMRGRRGGTRERPKTAFIAAGWVRDNQWVVITTR
jgi:hypothetical protein